MSSLNNNNSSNTKNKPFQVKAAGTNSLRQQALPGTIEPKKNAFSALFAGARANPTQNIMLHNQNKRKADNKIKEEANTKRLKEEYDKLNRDNAELQRKTQQQLRGGDQENSTNHSSHIVPRDWLAPEFPFENNNFNDINLSLLMVDAHDKRIGDIPPHLLEITTLPESLQKRTNKPPKKPSGSTEDDLDNMADWHEEMARYKKGPQEYHVQVPVVRMKSICENGCEVLTNVYGVRPRGMIPIPTSWSQEILKSTFPELSILQQNPEYAKYNDGTKFQLPRDRRSEWPKIRQIRNQLIQANPIAKKYCEKLQNALEARLQSDDQERKYPQLRYICGDYTSAMILKVTPLLRESMWGYNHDEQIVVFEITFSVSKVKQLARKIFKDGFRVLEHQIKLEEDQLINFTLSLEMQFLIDRQLTGMCWYTLPKLQYQIVTGALPEEENYAYRYLQEDSKMDNVKTPITQKDQFADIDIATMQLEALALAADFQIGNQDTSSSTEEIKQSGGDRDMELDDETGEQLQVTRLTDDERAYLELLNANQAQDEDENLQVHRSLRKKTWLRAELHVHANNIISHDRDSAWEQLPNLRTLAFDIECAGKDGHFPRPGKLDSKTREVIDEGDPIISISCVMQPMVGERQKLVMLWRIPKDPIKHHDNDPNVLHMKGCKVIMCHDERDMLLFFADLIRNTQPSVITGYNIYKFDWKYLLDRAQTLKIDTFSILSPYRECAAIKESIFQSSAMGQQQRCDFICPGLFSYDLLRYVVTELKLKSNTLNYVSQTILQSSKNDVSHHEIPKLFWGTAEERKRLLEYNIKDSDLVLDIMWHPKQQILMRNTEICRVTGVTMDMLITKGQGVKTESQLFRLMAKHGFVAPNKSRTAQHTENDAADVLDGNGDIDDSFTGAFCCSETTRITLSDGTCVPIKDVKENDQVLGYFTGDMEKDANREFVGASKINEAKKRGVGIVSAKVRKFIKQPFQKDCIKLTLLDGREIEVTKDHRMMKSDGTYVKAGDLHVADSMKVAIKGCNSLLYDDALSSGWQLNTAIGTLTNNTVKGKQQLFAIGQILGACLSDGSVMKRGTNNRAILCTGYQLDAEQMVEWVFDACNENITFLKHEKDFSVQLPKDLANTIANLRGDLKHNQRRIPQLLVQPDCPKILQQGFLRGLFGGDGKTFHLARGHKNHNSRFEGVGFIQSCNVEFEDDLKQYFVDLQYLLKIFEINSSVRNQGFKARWPSNGKSNIFADEFRRTIKQTLVAKGIKSATIHERIGALCGNGGRIEMVLSLYGYEDNKKFADSIGFGACFHKTLRLEAGMAIYGIRERMKTLSFEIMDRSDKLYTAHPERSWKNAVSVAKQDIEGVYGVIPYENEWKTICDPDRVYHALHGKKKRKNMDRGTVLVSQAWPTQVTLAKQIDVYKYFDNSSDEKGNGKGNTTYATNRDKLTLSTFEIPIVKIEEIGKQDVYDIEVPLTSNFLAEGIVVHNCLEPRVSFYSRPIATLDFASLYPSIMIAYNFSYDTILLNPDIDRQRLRPDQVERIDVKDKEGNIEKTFYYVKREVRQGLLCELVEYLLAQRNVVKGLINAATARGENFDLLEARSLALKLASNSAYGFCAAYKLYMKEISECVCAKGRDGLEATQNEIQNHYTPKNGYPQCKTQIVYGDSVTADTPILVRDPSSGLIFYRNISNLHQRESEWTKFHNDKFENQPFSQNLECWTELGWTKIKKIIKHKNKKEIVRVLTHSGVVDVTTDHSLLTEHGQKITPKGVKIGTKLLHSNLPNPESAAFEYCNLTEDEAFVYGLFYATDCWTINPDINFEILESSSASSKLEAFGYSSFRAKFYDEFKQKQIPVEIINANRSIQSAFYTGYCEGGRCDNEGKIGTAGLYYIMNRLGYAVSITTKNNNKNTTNYRLNATRNDATQQIIPNANAIKKIVNLGIQDGDVYDLETENHHFAAGVGKLIVHNTDSVMVDFGVNTVHEANILAQDAEKRCNKLFKAPIRLEFEKVSFPNDDEYFIYLVLV